MVTHLDGVNKWVLQHIRILGDEGTTISQLLQHVKKQFPDTSTINGSTTDQLWEALVALEYVVVGDDARQALKKLSLDDVLALGLGEKKIWIRGAQDAAEGGSAQTDHPANEEADVSKTNASTIAASQPFSVTSGKMTTADDAENHAIQILDVGTADGTVAAVSEHPQAEARTKKRGRPPKSGRAESPAHARPRPNPSRGQPEATFRSQEELDLEAGIPGVYIRPAVAKPPVQGRGRTRHTFVIVFKFEKLRDPNWLEDHKGTWTELVTERIAEDLLRKQEEKEKGGTLGKEYLTPRKRKRPDLIPGSMVSSESLGAKKPRKSKKLNSGITNLNAETLPEVPSTGLQLAEVGNAGQVGPPANRTFLNGSPFQISPVAGNEKRSYSPQQGFQLPPTIPPHQSQVSLDHQGPTMSLTERSGENRSPIATPASPSLQISPAAVAFEQSFADFDVQTPQTFPIGRRSSADSPSTSSASRPGRKGNPSSNFIRGLPRSNPPAHALTSPMASNNVKVSRIAPRHVASPRQLKAANGPRPRASHPRQTYTLLPPIPYISPYAPVLVNPQERKPITKAVFPLHGQMDTRAQLPRQRRRAVKVPRGAREQTFPEPGSPGNLTVGRPQSVSSSAAYPRALPEVHISPPVDVPTVMNSFKMVSPVAFEATPDFDNSQPIVRPSASAAPPESNSPSKKMKWKLRKTPSENLEEFMIFEKALSDAAALQLPDNAGRISASYESVVGNLFLTEDKLTLEFREANDDTISLSIPVSSIVLNPIISARGSYPMELRVRANDPKNTQVFYNFEFATTDTASEAANALRAKIVTSMVALQIRGGGSYGLNTVIKPFKCDKCGSRFKNKNGVEYHLQKSNTTCNPNFEAPAFTPRPRGRPPGPNKVTRKMTREPSPSLDEDSSSEEQGSDVSSSGSEDSVIEWFERHAVSGYGIRPSAQYSSPRKEETPRKHKNFPREISVLEEVLDQIPNNTFDEEVDDLFDAQDSLQLQNAAISDDGRGLQMAKDIITDLTSSNGGIFPAGRGLWFAFVAAWMKKHAGSSILPESKLCNTALDELVSMNALDITPFTFRDSLSRQVTRSYITKPGASISQNVIKIMMDLIKESHPGHYVPSAFAPPNQVLERLQDLTKRPVKRVIGDRDRAGSSMETDSRRGFVSSDDDGFGTDEEAINSEDGFFEDSEEDDKEHTWKKIAGRSRPSRKPRAPKPRWASWNEATSRSSRAWWTAKKASDGYESKPRNSRPCSSIQTWQNQATFLPDPETGAWNRAPIRVRKSYERSWRQLPEPVTFLQTTDGAWSIRPFGHGVKPIYSRPARRVPGNPNEDRYNQKIESGFRPIVYPTRSRMHRPQPPSNRLHKTLAQQDPNEPVNIGELGLRRKGRRAKVKIQAGQNPETEGPSVRGKHRRLPRQGRTVQDDVLPRFRSDAEEGDGFMENTLWSTRSRDAVDMDVIDPALLTEDSAWRALPSPNTEEHLLFTDFAKLKPALETRRNPGLDSLPSSFGLSRGATQVVEEGLGNPSDVQFLASRSVRTGSDLGDGFSWALDGWQPSIVEAFELKWLDENAFDLETLPYDLLVDFSTVDTLAPEPLPKQRKMTVPSEKKLLYTTRHQTAFLRDFEAISRDPEGVASRLAVEISGLKSKSHLKRAFPLDVKFQMERRLMVAVVMFRTLAGGLQMLIDWVLVSMLFKDYSTETLKKIWYEMYKKKRAEIEKLGKEFQEAFLTAYEDGELPPIDYDHLVTYDWEFVIKWALQNLDSSLLPTNSIALPDSRENFEEQYTITSPPPPRITSTSAYFDSKLTVYKRYSLVTSNAATSGIKPPKKFPNQLTDLQIAKSLVRATALTPTSSYSSSHASSLLRPLGEPIVTEALSILTTSRILLHRTSRGGRSKSRAYEPSDSLTATLRGPISIRQFTQAVSFKRHLDEAFRSGEQCVRCPQNINEGAMMVVTSLQANGRIELRGSGIPHNKFGFTDGAYETRKIPKETFHFAIDVYPIPEGYMFSADNPLVADRLFAAGSTHSSAELEPPPGPGPQGELPIWRGISGDLIREMWERVLCAVAGTVAIRAGIALDGIVEVFKPVLEYWEVRVLMEWGVRRGIFERIAGQAAGDKGLQSGNGDGNAHGGEDHNWEHDAQGWTVGKWWWEVVGREVKGKEVESESVVD